MNHSNNLIFCFFDLTLSNKFKEMTTIELKSNLHKLIDNINNDSVLSKFYEILERANQTKEGSLWGRLSAEEQQELLAIEKESHFSENLIPHSQMIKKHQKWL